MARSVSALGLAFALLVAYVALRLVAAPDWLVLGWMALAALAALASPLAGVAVLAALGPFTEALTDDGRVTAVPVLLVALGLSVGVRIAVTRPWWRPSLPVVLGIVLAAATLAGALVTWAVAGPGYGRAALELWIPSIGGAITCLVCGAWLGSRDEGRPLAIAAGAAAAAALVALIDYAAGGAIQAGALGWLLRPGDDPGRLTGVIPGPNSAAAIYVVAAVCALGALLLVRDRAVRALGALALLVSVAALVLTYSRSGVLGLSVGAAFVLWARWRRVGLAVGVLTVALGVLTIASVGLVREIPSAIDQDRITGWTAGLRMWLANPLFGAGFRSFEWQHAAYGSLQVNAPHNEWLRLFAEEGVVVGVVGIAFALLTPFELARSHRIGATCAAGVAAAIFLMACFNNPFLYIQVNVPTFIVVGTGLGLAMRSRSVPAPEVPSGSPSAASSDPPSEHDPGSRAALT